MHKQGKLIFLSPRAAPSVVTLAFRVRRVGRFVDVVFCFVCLFVCLFWQWLFHWKKGEPHLVLNSLDLICTFTTKFSCKELRQCLLSSSTDAWNNPGFESENEKKTIREFKIHISCCLLCSLPWPWHHSSPVTASSCFCGLCSQAEILCWKHCYYQCRKVQGIKGN